MKIVFPELYNDVFTGQFSRRGDRCVVFHGVGTNTMGIVNIVVVILLRRFNGDTIRVEDISVSRVNFNVMPQ